MNDLYQQALAVIHPMTLKQYGKAGHVGCALEIVQGNIYTGICVDVPCSIGMCAEQAAIAEMLKHGETAIAKIVAVYEDGNVLPPCGRCRELMAQVDESNHAQTVVMVETNRSVRLQELLPERWDVLWD